MNQNYYFENKRCGLVSDDEGNIRIVSVDGSYDNCGIMEILRMENNIEKCEKSIKKSEEIISKKRDELDETGILWVIMELMGTVTYSLIWSILAMGSSLPVSVLFCIVGGYSLITGVVGSTCYFSKKKEVISEVNMKKDNELKLGKLREKYRNVTNNTNYRTVQPSMVNKENEVEENFYDFSIRGDSETLDVPRGKVYFLER